MQSNLGLRIKQAAYLYEVAQEIGYALGFLGPNAECSIIFAEDALTLRQALGVIQELMEEWGPYSPYPCQTQLDRRRGRFTITEPQFLFFAGENTGIGLN